MGVIGEVQGQDVRLTLFLAALLRGQVGSGRLVLLRAGGLLGLFLRGLDGDRLVKAPRQGAQQGAQDEERDHRKAGDQAEREAQARGDRQRLRPAQHLRADVQAQVRVLELGRDTRDDQTGRHRNQQRGDHRDQSVTDRQGRVQVRGLARAHPIHHHADDHAGDDVDHADDHARQRVALDELHRAVHRAEQLGFTPQVVALAPAFLHRRASPRGCPRRSTSACPAWRPG